MKIWNGKTPFVKGHKIRVGSKHTPAFRDMRKSVGNPNWKGDNATYWAMHTWAKQHWGRPQECEHCHSSSAYIYDWASKDHMYGRNREDWLRLCRSCHMKYDYEKGFRKSRTAVRAVTYA